DKGSSSRTDRIKVTIINKSEAPLEETKFKVMLELMGNESGNERPGLDLVIVLDRSMSMKGEKLEKMKLAMQLVIKKLSPIDRLSIVKFNGNSKRLCPLHPMTENSQAEIKKLVNNLTARGTTNIYAGLKTGSRVLKDRRFTSERVDAIMLLSDGPQDQQYTDVAVDNVPVYTFGLGADYDPKVLNAIANKSRGGTFTDVQNEDNLSIAFSQCLDGLLTVAVQDLKVTFTQQNSTIENVSTGNYPQSNDVGSVTVLLGDLYEKELRKVIVDLLLPAVSSAQNGTDVLQISYTYRCIGEEPVEGKPIFSSVNRVLTSNELEREELKTEEISNKTVQWIKKAREMADMQKLGEAKDIIVEAQKWLEDEVDEPKQLIDMLTYELQQLLNLMETQDIYHNLGRSFAISCETSHDRQRFAAKGPSFRTKMRIINKTEAPLKDTKFKVMLELTGNESGNQRPGLDLVTVLDVSGNMRGKKLKEMKIALQLMIKKLSPIDRLSVVTFSSDSKSLCPLCHINENSRVGIANLVKNLEAQDQGPVDISAGLEIGLKVLNERMYTSGRVVAIMLLSGGRQNPKSPNATEVEVGNVPIYTFDLGTNPKLLKSIADNSGGTFKNVQNLENLREEFSQFLSRLLTVEVQNLEVTFKKVNSAIKNVYAGNYPQFRDDGVGSVTVSFGNLYKKEPQEVKVNLLLPAFSSTQCTDILRISYTYSFGGELIRSIPRIVTITRRNSTPMINEARVVTDKQLEFANKMISEAQKLLRHVFDETLNSELQQLKRLMNSQKLYNEQETEEVTNDEIRLLTAEGGEGTIRSLEDYNSTASHLGQASSVHSNNDLKKFPIEFLLDRTGVRKRIPESLNRSKNYVDWSEKVKKDLEELNLWKVIEEAPIETTESIENVDMGTAIKKLRQFRENWMALILINHACGFPINLQIIDLHSARAAWETLATNRYQGLDVESFLSAVERDDWKKVERLLDSNSELAKARIPFSQNTVLHLASLAGEVNIVKKLVALMVPQDLEIQDKDGYTALTKASIHGDKKIAQCMVEKNKNLVSIPTGTKLLPVVIAIMFGNKEMALYLYSKTPQKFLLNEDNNSVINGATLLTYSIRMQLYDISFHLIQKYPRLAFALDHYDQSALYQLACTPSAFRNSSQLNFWQRLVYICVPVQDIDWEINETRLSVLDEDVSQSNWWNAGYRGIWQQIAPRLLAVLGIKRIYEMKLVHHQSHRLLRRICQDFSNLHEDEMVNGIINALHEAAAKGVVELVADVLEKLPELRRFRDKQGSTIFMKAVEFRQEQVFSLLQGFAYKDTMIDWVDDRGENILHKLKYNSVDKISNIQGAVLKMQKELQWLE
ncbi:hypothetical protein UlMin_011177, partial [Ulmus minor]